MVSKILTAPKLKKEIEERGAVNKKLRGPALIGQEISLANKKVLDDIASKLIQDATMETVLSRWKAMGGEKSRQEALLTREEHLQISIEALQKELLWLELNPERELEGTA